MSVDKIRSFDLNAVDNEVTFILDTNILYFIHSGYYSSSSIKNTEYSNLVQQIIKKGNDLVVTSLNLQEFVFGIENKEYELYLDLTGKNRKSFTKKDFRKDPALRADVQAKIKTVMTEVKATYKLCDITVEAKEVESFMNDFTQYLYDPMDYLVVNATRQGNIIYISDDTDFQSDSRVSVLTL